MIEVVFIFRLITNIICYRLMDNDRFLKVVVIEISIYHK